MKHLIGIILTLLCLNLWSTLAAASTQECRYISEGTVQQSWKKVRLQNQQGEAIAGAETFSEALALAENLLQSQVCTAQVQDCRMASEGIVAGVWMKHRLQMDREIVFGADDLATALKYLSGLRRLGFCQ